MVPVNAFSFWTSSIVVSIVMNLVSKFFTIETMRSNLSSFVLTDDRLGFGVVDFGAMAIFWWAVPGVVDEDFMDIGDFVDIVLSGDFGAWVPWVRSGVSPMFTQGGATRLVKRHMFPQKIRKIGHLLRGITMILVSIFTSS